MQRMKISAALIIRDEQDNIYKCLESIKGVVNEIILVDTGSIDNTLDEVRRFTADHKAKNGFQFEEGLIYTLAIGERIINLKLFLKQWNDNFADMRNYSLSKATGDWILVMDADEIIEEQYHDMIREVVKLDADVWQMLIVSDFNNGQIQHELVRLFRNGKGIKYSYPLHESIEPSIQGLKMGKVEVVINHSGYSKPSKAKSDRNYRIMSKHPEHPLYNYYMGLMLIEKGDNKGFEMLSKVKASNGITAQIFNLFAERCLQVKDFAGAESNLRKSLEYAPKQLEAHKVLSEIYLYQDKFDEAIAELEAILNKNGIKSDLMNDTLYKQENIINAIKFIRTEQNGISNNQK